MLDKFGIHYLVKLYDKWLCQAFAAEAHLGRTYMGRIENGEQNVSIQNLIKIALNLKVEIRELVPSLNLLKKPV